MLLGHQWILDQHAVAASFFVVGAKVFVRRNELRPGAEMELEDRIVATAGLVAEFDVLGDRQFGMAIISGRARYADDPANARHAAGLRDLAIDQLATETEAVNQRRCADGDELIDLALGVVRIAEAAAVGQAAMRDRAGREELMRDALGRGDDGRG